MVVNRQHLSNIGENMEFCNELEQSVVAILQNESQAVTDVWDI